jgi:hypothetical protein
VDGNHCTLGSSSNSSAVPVALGVVQA